MLYIHHKEPKFLVMVNLKCMSRSFKVVVKENYPDANPRYSWMYPEIKSENDLSDYYKFGVVRNPYDRVVSSFESKINKDWKNDFHNIHSEIFNYFNFEKTSPDEKQNFLNNLTFKKFTKFIRENAFSNEHIIPQFLLYINGKGGLYLNDIFKLEEISTWRSKLKSKLNVNIPHKNKTNRDRDYKKWYSYRSKIIVKSVYRRDLELFNYTF